MNSDFVNKESVEFKINGKTWAFMPISAGEENEWMQETLVYKKVQKPDGTEAVEIFEDPSRKNRCKIRNLTKVPYSSEELSELLGLDEPTEWKDLSNEEKWEVISLLQRKIYAQLIREINNIIDSSEDDIKKSVAP